MKKVKQSKKRWALTEAQKRRDRITKSYKCRCNYCVHPYYDYRRSAEHFRIKPEE